MNRLATGLQAGQSIQHAVPHLDVPGLDENNCIRACWGKVIVTLALICTVDWMSLSQSHRKIQLGAGVTRVA